MSSITIDSKLLASFIVVFTLLVNVALAYFNISGSVACQLTRLSPETQQTASAAVGR